VILEIPGYGDVEIEEKDLPRVLAQLDVVFAGYREKLKQDEQYPKQLLEVLGDIRSGQKDIAKALAAEIKKIPAPKVEIPKIPAPVVNVPAPVVHVPAPVVNVESPEIVLQQEHQDLQPMKMRITNIERDYRGMITGAVDATLGTLTLGGESAVVARSAGVGNFRKDREYEEVNYGDQDVMDLIALVMLAQRINGKRRQITH
jgi:hypothetical protein